MQSVSTLPKSPRKAASLDLGDVGVTESEHELDTEVEITDDERKLQTPQEIHELPLGKLSQFRKGAVASPRSQASLVLDEASDHPQDTSQSESESTIPTIVKPPIQHEDAETNQKHEHPSALTESGLALQPQMLVDVLDLRSGSVWRQGIVLKIDISDPVVARVKIGYLGWSSKWDEWVPTDENRIQSYQSQTSSELSTGFRGREELTSEDEEQIEDENEAWIAKFDPLVYSHYKRLLSTEEQNLLQPLAQDKKVRQRKAKTRSKRTLADHLATLSQSVQAEQPDRALTWEESIANDPDRACVYIGSLVLLSSILFSTLVVVIMSNF